MESQMNSWDALAALDWQIELGADEAIAESPINRFEQPKKPAKAEPPAAAPAQPPESRAQSLAAAATTLDDLHRALAEFDGSPLREAAQNCVFADGLAGARVMILGEAPGRDEDRQGKPFVGRAGQLLDKMLAAIDLDRRAPAPENAVYIANILPWRPPQNRTPTADEIALFMPFVARHIALADPEILVVMGNTPCQALLGRSGITRLRGTWTQAQDRPCVPMFHPAYLLRTPAAKRETWADLLALKARLMG